MKNNHIRLNQNYGGILYYDFRVGALGFFAGIAKLNVRKQLYACGSKLEEDLNELNPNSKLSVQ